MRNIYAIRDRVANDLAGMFPLVVMRTDAQAVRFFGDSLTADKSALGQHPDDYELIKVGILNDDGGIIPRAPEIIITGYAFFASSAPETK